MGGVIFDNAFALLQRANTWISNQVLGNGASLSLRNEAGDMSYTPLTVYNDNTSRLVLQIKTDWDNVVLSGKGNDSAKMYIGGGNTGDRPLVVSAMADGAGGVLIGDNTAGGMPGSVGNINAAGYELSGLPLIRNVSGANGYMYVTSSGVRTFIQWGSVTASSNSSSPNTITFPTTFPVACRSVIITPTQAGSELYISTKTTSSFNVHNAGNSRTFNYIAIGN